MSKSSGIVLNCKNLGDIFDDSRNHRTIINHNAIPVRGLHGRGMYFNGTTAYLDCGNHSSLNITDAITIESWVKSNINDAYQGIVAKIEGDWANGCQIMKHNANKFRFTITKDSFIAGANSNVAYTDSNWHYLVGFYDGTAYLYVDGILQADTGVGNIGDNSVNLGIGTYYNGGAVSNPFNGIISLVRIYNYALSADEIKLHYRQQSPYYQEEAPTIIL